MRFTTPMVTVRSIFFIKKAICRKRDRGATLIEFALSLPLFIIFVFGMIDLCIMIVMHAGMSTTLSKIGEVVSRQHSQCEEKAQEVYRELMNNEFSGRYVGPLETDVHYDSSGKGKIMTLTMSATFPCLFICPLLRMKTNSTNLTGDFTKTVVVRLEDPYAECPVE